MSEITDIVTNLKGWLDDWRDIEADCVGLNRQLKIEQKEVLRRSVAEIEKLRLDVSCLKVQVKDRGNSYKAKVQENEKLRTTLKEVSALCI
jgi:hypothetical protein